MHQGHCQWVLLGSKSQRTQGTACPALRAPVSEQPWRRGLHRKQRDGGLRGSRSQERSSQGGQTLGQGPGAL